MKHSYYSSSDSSNLKKLLFFTIFLGVLYAGMLYVVPNRISGKTSQNISQIISGDSLSKNKISQSVIDLFPSGDGSMAPDRSNNDGNTFQESSQAFKFLGAILQLLLNFYRL